MFRTDRRSFLSASAAAAGAMVLGGAPLAAADSQQKRLQLGVIGVGWYGMVDAEAAIKCGDVDVAAICDVDSDHLETSAAQLQKLQGKRPQTFKQYEDLLRVKSLDAVIIATPPHWHALQLLAALEQGKDVYCEKPLAYDLREGQAMVAAAERSKSIVQVGFQRRQSAAFQAAVQFVQSGGVGELVQVDAQIHYRAGLEDPQPQAPPATLDWDLWCGPGPLIPYSPQVGHKSWRLEHTSGHGHLVDWGIHLIDTARSMLALGMPRRIIASGGLYHLAGRITTPDTMSVHFEFDKVPLHWRHRLWGATEFHEEFNNGIFFFGTEGTVFATDTHWIVQRPSKEPEKQEAQADMGVLHMADFLDAVRTRRAPSCTVASAWESTATVKLAMISLETNTVVHWDNELKEIINNAAASALLQRPYREPWVHPYTG